MNTASPHAKSRRQMASKCNTATGKRRGLQVELLERRLLLHGAEVPGHPEWLDLHDVGYGRLELSTLPAHERVVYEEYHLDPLEPDFVEVDQVDGEPVEAASSLSTATSPVFKLHSKPGANHVLYLDFDGHITEGTTWNSAYGVETIYSPPYKYSSNDSDPYNFDSVELDVIETAFWRVAEDFAAFDIDVTTEEPGLDRLIKSSAEDTQWGLRVVMTQDTFANCGCGGHAYYNSFNAGTDQPVFVYNRGYAGVSEAITHEAGHALNLAHDGATGIEYYQGHKEWAPIMGNSYSETITTWTKGDYYDASNTEDDLVEITTLNGFGYRSDDHQADLNLATASALDVTGTTNLSGFGRIEQNTDLDVFAFTTGGGTVSLSVNALDEYYRPNVDLWAGLYDASGTLIAEANPQGFAITDVTLNATVAAGTYFLKVDGVGKFGTYDAATDTVLDPWAPNDPAAPWNDPNSADRDGYTDYGSLGQYSISGTIVAPGSNLLSLVATDGNKSEGNNNGTNDYRFTVSRDAAGNLDAITVDYQVEPATISTPTESAPYVVDGADFVGGSLPSGTVTFAQGQTTAEITVQVVGDLTFERDESFRVVLSNPTSGWHLADSVADGTIVTDEAEYSVAPSLYNSTFLLEGDSGSTSFDFIATREGDLSGAATLDWQVDVSGVSQPASGDDFVGGQLPTGTVSFADGESFKVFSVFIATDLAEEGDENFSLALTAASGTIPSYVSPETGQASGRILDDEATVSIGDGSTLLRWRQVANSGGTFDNWGLDNVSLPSDGFADDFDPDVDASQWTEIVNGLANTTFTGSSGNSLFFSSANDRWATTRQLQLGASETVSFDLIFGDSANGGENADGGEDVVLEYSRDAGSAWTNVATYDTEAYLSWTNINQALPAEVETDVRTASEGDAGTASFTFSVTRTGYLGKALSVNWSVVGSGASPADGLDFDGGVLPSGTLNFNSGDQTKKVTILVAGDALEELDETFDFVLNSSSAGALGTSQQTATILNDDTSNNPPTVSVTATDSAASEGSPVDPGAFTVSRTGDTSAQLTVFYSMGGTATEGSDYQGLSGVVTINAGSSTAVINLVPIDDGVSEPSETAIMTLSADASYLIGGGASDSVTILDDDFAELTLNITDVAISEEGGVAPSANEGTDDSESVFVVVEGPSTTATVTRNSDTTSALTVTLVNGDATEISIPTTVEIPAGQSTSNPFTINAVDDQVIDGTQTVTITATAVGYLDSSGTIDVLDNDTPVVTVSATDNAAAEELLEQGTFTVIRTGVTDAALEVFYTLAGSAVQGNDYQTLAGVVTIPAASNSAVVTVDPIDDLFAEGSETVILTISADASYILGSEISDTVTITDNDDPITTRYTADSGGFSLAGSYRLNEEPTSDGLVSNTHASGDNAVQTITEGTLQLLATSNVTGDGVTTYGELTGSYLGTLAAGDSNVQRLTDARVGGGKPSRRPTALDHTWTVDVANANAFYIQAERFDAGGNEDYTFQWSSNNGTSWNTIAVLGSQLNGSLHKVDLSGQNIVNANLLRVWTNPQEDDTFQDALEIDLIYFEGAASETSAIERDYTWSFSDIDGAETFYLQGSSSDTEPFNVDYSTDGGANWQPLGSITNTTTALTVDLSSNPVTAPTTLVRVVDADRSENELTKTMLSVDAMHFEAVQTDLRTVVDVALTAGPAAEEGQQPAVFTFSRTNPDSNDLKVYFDLGGTATDPQDETNPIDYEANYTEDAVGATYVVIAANQSSTTLTITPVDDIDAEGNETISVTLIDSPSYAFRPGIDNSASTDLVDDDLLSYVPLSEVLGAGTQNGTYVALTAQDDGALQTLTERESGGKPANRHTYLIHTYDFGEVSGVQSFTAIVTQSTNSGPNDDFVFEYNADGSNNWMPLGMVAAGTADNVAVDFPSPISSAAGQTMRVRITDFAQNSGERTKGSITMDYLVFSTLPLATESIPMDASASTTDAEFSFQSSIDANGDGNVTVLDALLVINYVAADAGRAESEELSIDSIDRQLRFDMNQDGKVTVADALMVINSIKTTQDEQESNPTSAHDGWAVSVDNALSSMIDDDDVDAEILINDLF